MSVHCHLQMHRDLNSDEETQASQAPRRHMCCPTGRILFSKEDCLRCVVLTPKSSNLPRCGDHGLQEYC